MIHLNGGGSCESPQKSELLSSHTEVVIPDVLDSVVIQNSFECQLALAVGKSTGGHVERDTITCVCPTLQKTILRQNLVPTARMELCSKPRIVVARFELDLDMRNLHGGIEPQLFHLSSGASESGHEYERSD